MSSPHVHFRYLGCVAVVCLCVSVVIMAATFDFRGVVRSMDGVAVVREEIHVDAGGTYLTSDSGEFTIPASEGLKVGAEVVFRVAHWVVLRPCELQNGRTYLPLPERPIQIKVLRRGDQRLKSIAPVESALDCIIEEAAARFPRGSGLKQRRKSSRGIWPRPAVQAEVEKPVAFAVIARPSFDRSKDDMVEISYSTQPQWAVSLAQLDYTRESERHTFMARKADELGFSAEELESAINAWASSAREPYQRGLAALWRGRFAEATKYISESISSTPEGDLKRYVPLARAAFEQGNYAEATAALRKILAIHENDSVILNDLRTVMEVQTGGGNDGSLPSDQSSAKALWQRIPNLQRIILAVLFGMLSFSIGVTIARWMAFTAAREQSRAFALVVAGALREGNIDEAIRIAERNRKSHLARVVSAGLMEFRTGQQGGETPDETIETSRRALVRTEAAVRTELRRGMGGLATIGSTAPFVGLVGTVFGILKAFTEIATSHATGLAAVAGGIAEALITTAIGFFVAVSSVAMFKYLSGRLEAFDVEMRKSSNELIDYLSTQRSRRSI